MHVGAGHRLLSGVISDGPWRAALAVCAATTIAFLVNRALARSIGETGAAVAAAFVEETAKTVSAAALVVPIIAAHFLFGLVESVYDIRRSPRRQAGMAAAASVLGHAAFGAVTAAAWRMTGWLPAGLAAGIGLHLCWNLLITGGMNGAPQGNR